MQFNDKKCKTHLLKSTELCNKELYLLTCSCRFHFILLLSFASEKQCILPDRCEYAAGYLMIVEIAIQNVNKWMKSFVYCTGKF